MKQVFFQAGSVLIFAFTTINICDARPGNHKHHHNQRLPCEIATVEVGSGSRSINKSYKDHCDKSNSSLDT